MTAKEKLVKDYYALLYFICMVQEMLEILGGTTIITDQEKVAEYWKEKKAEATKKYEDIQKRGKISMETLDKILRDPYLKDYRTYFEHRFFHPDIITQMDKPLGLLKIKK